MSKRKSFYVRIPLPDGARCRFFRVKVSVFTDAIELNNHVHKNKFWPRDRFVCAFNIGYPAGDRRAEAWSHIMLAEDISDIGAVAHEAEHAVLFMMREVLGIKRIDLVPTNRFKNANANRLSANATEEFICLSLQRLLVEIYEKAKEKEIVL